MRKLHALALAGALIAGALVPSIASGKSDQAKVTKSDNVVELGQNKYKGGTELSTDGGKYLISSELDGDYNPPSRGTMPEKGGMHIMDISKGGKPVEVGFLHCPGNDNDVEFVKPGLALLGFATNKCAPAAGEGFVTVDVRNPKKPRILGMVNTQTNHTFKPIPGTDYVYTAGGGLSGGGAAGPAIVDISNPAKPKVVGKGQTLTMDCHDISFYVKGDTRLGFCAGAIGTGEVQIWDISDPESPQQLGKIVNPLIQYSHYAVASPDGKLLAIDDEAFAAHDCNTGVSPTGRVWIYDISNPSLPLLQSSFAPPRGGDGTANIGTYPGWAPSWCLSHGLDWAPKGRNLAVTWFTGGWGVLNLDNPLQPTEVAYFQAEDSATYSVLWVGKYLYSNDMNSRGTEGFLIKGLK
ncbi:MAG: LVIVD repeat-containing protein [Actinomycetota bacterium]